MFLVLPRSCIENSRYLDSALLARIMRHIGFIEVRCKNREGAKVVYSLWQKQSPTEDSDPSELATKREVRSGGNRNNFCVHLK
jgi:25S rRNA (adenine2142-N1)-methyltransferase